MASALTNAPLVKGGPSQCFDLVPSSSKDIDFTELDVADLDARACFRQGSALINLATEHRDNAHSPQSIVSQVLMALAMGVAGHARPE